MSTEVEEKKLSICELAKQFSFAKTALLVSAVSATRERIVVHLVSSLQAAQQRVELVREKTGSWERFRITGHPELKPLELEDVGIATVLATMAELPV